MAAIKSESVAAFVGIRTVATLEATAATASFAVVEGLRARIAYQKAAGMARP